MQKGAFLTLHGSNLQHLINSHLRGCLQATSVRWQHTSPSRRKDFCHAPRDTSVAAAAEAAPRRAKCQAQAGSPPHAGQRRSPAWWRWSPPLPSSSLGLGWGQNDSCTLHLGPTFTRTWKPAVCRVFSEHWLEQ